MKEDSLTFVSSKTDRGFNKLSFNDYYEQECNLQESSIATQPCIWLGIAEGKPRILTTNAIKLGYITEKEAEKNDLGQPCGWMDYELPKEVFIPTRMRLTKEQAMQLVMKLLEFSFTEKMGE